MCCKETDGLKIDIGNSQHCSKKYISNEVEFWLILTFAYIENYLIEILFKTCLSSKG